MEYLDKNVKSGDSNTENYGQMYKQLGRLLNDRSQGQNNTGQEKVINTSGPAIEGNSISMSDKIPNEAGLHQISGWEKPFKGSALKRAVKQLNLFHQSLNGEVSISNLEAVNHADKMYENLVREVRSFVDGAQKSSSWFHKEEEAALLPAMSSLLIHLYSMGNAFDNRENLTYDYLMEGNHQTARVGDIMTGHGAMSVQGNMVSTGIQSGQIDRTAKQMNKWDGNDKEVDYLQELKARRLPSLGEKNADQELQRIAEMLEEIELQAENSILREDIRTQFFDVTKMIHILLQISKLMKKDDEIKEPIIYYQDNDLKLTEEFYKATAGMTVGEAVEKLDEIRQSKAETAAQDSISTGGALSQVLIDTEKKRVLRTTKEKKGITKQKKRNNFNYDEAMSRLGEVTGLGSQAGARATYYKDKEGKLQYGTNMDMAAGKSARDVKLSFGDAKADKQMRGGRHNIFGYGSKEELEKNAGLIISSFKLQILDYLALHQDRHNENYFIDLDAEDPEQAFVGIDNDNVFGIGIAAEREHRTVSYKQHASGSYEGTVLHGKMQTEYKDVATTLLGFQCIPQETADQIAALDEKKIGEAMKPYLDRAARFALMRRIRNLKEYASKNAKIIKNIHGETGMKEFKKETMSAMIRTIMDIRDDDNLLGSNGLGSNARMMPGILMRTLMMQYFNRAGNLRMKEGKPGEYVYQPEFEYVPEGQSIPEYINDNNKKERNQKFWFTFMRMIDAAGMSPKEVWDKFVPKEEKYQKHKEAFLKGEMRMFFDWNV